MKHNAETLADKWFKIGRIRNKFEFQKDLELVIKDAVEKALHKERPDDINDISNYRVAIRETDEKYFIIYKDLVHQIPANWSVIIPNRGTLSRKFYSEDGILGNEFFKKFKVIKTEAELRLNS